MTRRIRCLLALSLLFATSSCDTGDPHLSHPFMTVLSRAITIGSPSDLCFTTPISASAKCPTTRAKT
jgi:hypothetical protein